MKTLDEVIKAYEIHTNPEAGRCITDCPYHGECVHDEEMKDALHYLKKYRDNYKARNDQIERYQKAAKECEEILTDYVALKQYWAEQQANPALTWDELRTMEGKPVWIWLSPRIKNTPGSGRWEIIYKFNPIGGNKNLFEMEMESRSRFRRKYQGDLWQAYRKERE